MRFLSIAKGEFVKIPAYLLLLWTIILGVIPVVVAVIAYIKGYENFASNGMANSSGLLLFYQFVNNYCVVALSALLWYFIFSRENTFNTWSILLTKIPSKFQILAAKSVVFTIYYLISVVICYVILLLICLTQDIEWTARSFVASFLISVFISISIGFLQFTLHILLKNGLIASSLSIVWVILLSLYSNLPEVVQSLFPLFISTYVAEVSKLADMSAIFIYILGSLLFILFIVMLSSRKNLFNTD
ncbi:hypothetical protein [Gracilibacillus xinjiangensis]|uniref:ABC-2 type transport system permease protein n=1 Tax=Gracilibacillus xinjiangensis TaxID=1193282 RepID=A0ABV8WSU0_9BACI